MKLTRIIVTTCMLTIFASANSMAGVVSSSAVIQQQQLQYDKQQLIGIVSAQETADKLTALGVSPNDAIDRINAMTAHEVAEFNQHLDKAETGGIVGVVVTVLVVVLVTDLLGITDAYPFIRPIAE